MGASPCLSNRPANPTGPTRRYCNLANELGARASGQWAMGRGGWCKRHRECKPIPRIVTRVQKEKCCTFGNYSAAC